MSISLLAYVANFSGQLYFWRSYFFTRLQNNYFNATVNFSEQVFLQSSCFFEELLFQYCYLCTAVNFSESHFFRAKLLLSSHFLRIEGSLGQLLFGAGTFLAEDFFRIKISTECHPFEAGCTTSTFSEEHNFGKSKLFRKAIFHITSLFWRASYLERLLFSKDATFCSSYLFRRAIFLQHTFSEKSLFDSYSSFPELYFYGIRLSHIFEIPIFQMKDLVSQSKYLVFQSKCLDFDRNARYFESEISKY